MSSVTSMIVLSNEREDSGPIQHLNQWCIDNAFGQRFTPIDIDERTAEDLEPLEEEAKLAVDGALPPRRRSGGSKVFSAQLYACGGNAFPREELVKAFPTFGWNSYSRDVTVLLWRHEDTDCWRGIHANGEPVFSSDEQRNAWLDKRAEALSNIEVLRAALDDEASRRAIVRWCYENPAKHKQLCAMLGVEPKTLL